MFSTQGIEFFLIGSSCIVPAGLRLLLKVHLQCVVHVGQSHAQLTVMINSFSLKENAFLSKTFFQFQKLEIFKD